MTGYRQLDNERSFDTFAFSKATEYSLIMTESAFWNISNNTAHNMSSLTSPISAFSTHESTTHGRAKIVGPVIYGTGHLIGTSVVLGLMILCTVVGNVFVIAAIILEKNLQNVANYLVLSLAVADLMVATMVMPLSVVSQISQVWFLNAAMCDMWTSFDILCCTASILHLLAISLDRYWAVTNIDYVRNRTAKRILIMIALVWIMALAISIPPLFGWKDPENNPEITGECIISQDHGYTIFSTVGAFYLPTLLMMIIYGKIFMVARARIRKKKFAQMNKVKMTQAVTVNTEVTNLTVRPQNESPSRVEASEAHYNGGSSGEHDDNENSKLRTNGHMDETTVHMLPKELKKVKKAKDKLEMKRERKAARTLGIITGAFIVCWLPFFIIAISNPFLERNQIPELVTSVVLWLGYFNSLLNPVIYTIFNPEFRNAFRKILFGKYTMKRRR